MRCAAPLDNIHGAAVFLTLVERRAAVICVSLMTCACAATEHGAAGLATVRHHRAEADGAAALLDHHLAAAGTCQSFLPRRLPRPPPPPHWPSGVHVTGASLLPTVSFNTGNLI